jgi:hypothetical protein
MNRFFWLLNGVLLVVGLLVTLAAVRFEPSHPTSSPAGVTADEPRTGKTAGGTRQLPAGNRVPPRGPSPEVVEVIWKQSLFRPDRGEDGAEGGAAAAENARTTDMELVGIGQINGEGAAIILIQNGASGMLPPGRRPDLPDTPGLATPFGRRGAGGLRRTPPGRTSTARGGGESSGQTHIFRLNQRVGTSGFVVKEVRIDTVVLLRGAEERVLKLDRNDASSKTRQESATRDAVARVPATPPPPPAPGLPGRPTFPGGGINAPPAFNAAGQPAAAGMPGTFPSREERIRTAIEARRRLMMDAQQPQNTPPRP